MSETEVEETKEEVASQNPMILLGDVLDGLTEKTSMIRKIGIVGDIEEAKTNDIIYSMILLHDTREREALKNPEDPNSEIEKVVDPFELIISTNGGDAREMFAIYDMMRHLRKDCEIHTLGLGKVMSAGVPILAAGTKGKRRIGKYCRVMLHNVSAGTIGAINQMQNEMKEVEEIQSQYIEILATETSMSEREIRDLISKNVNVYLSAEEALKLGIVDEII